MTITLDEAAGSEAWRAESERKSDSFDSNPVKRSD